MSEPEGVLLGRADLERAFTALGERLARRGIVADVFIVGGAAMALAYHAVRVTRDVDAIFQPHGIVHEEALRVAGDLGLPRWWLNEQASTYLAIWTGLDGYSSGTVEQISAEAYCSGGTPAYFGRYELYPGAAVDFSQTLKAGDSLQASRVYGSSKFTPTLHDETRGWTQTVTKTLPGAARSSGETVVQVPSTFTCLKPLTSTAFTIDTDDGSPLGSQHPVED